MITLGSGLLAELFGGFVVVEMLWSIPGLGTLLLEGATNNDIPLVMGNADFGAFVVGQHPYC